MMNGAAAIERLGVPEYDWWNEALHGVARAGIATVFPQAIGLAATWNPELIREVADATSTEARAKHHEFAAARRARALQGSHLLVARTSTSSATRAGAAGRRRSAKTRI